MSPSEPSRAPAAGPQPSTGPLSRRQLLRLAALGGGLLCTGRLPGLGVAPVASGLGAAASGTAGTRKLLVVQLSGGNDGLNTLVPFADDAYHRARPRLALAAKDLHRLDDGLGLHPSLGRLAARWHEGDVALVQGVGYPNPNRSHFKSMDIWHSGRPDGARTDSGWLGRALGSLPEAERSVECAVNLSTREPLALRARGFHPVSFTDAARFRMRTGRGQEEAVEALTGASADADEILALVGRTANDARNSSVRVREAVTAYRSRTDYPSSRFGRSLRTAAALLQADLGTRVLYTYLGSFDTHANQAGRHANLLGQLDGGLAAFQADLKASGAAEDVAILVFSEFGRRVGENASRGTDHGTAGPVMLLGPGVRAGLHGTAPDLAQLDNGDLVHTTDFRSIYRDLLVDWLGVDGGEFAGHPSLELFP